MGTPLTRRWRPFNVLGEECASPRDGGGPGAWQLRPFSGEWLANGANTDEANGERARTEHRRAHAYTRAHARRTVPRPVHRTWGVYFPTRMQSARLPPDRKPVRAAKRTLSRFNVAFFFPVSTAEGASRPLMGPSATRDHRRHGLSGKDRRRVPQWLKALVGVRARPRWVQP